MPVTAVALNGVQDLGRTAERLVVALSEPLDSPASTLHANYVAVRNLTARVQESALNLERVHQCSSDSMLDPDGELDADLLDAQTHLRLAWQEAVSLRRVLPLWRHPAAKVLAFAISSQFRKQFCILEDMRTLLREHDADASQEGPAFDDHDSLMRHLRTD